ncbi:MAG: hypothetical protein Q6L50_08475 [Gloeomargarita sp. GMQP_bins_120]
MIDTSIIGKLMYLYVDELEPGESPEVPAFVTRGAANLLGKLGGRNWLPIVVSILGKDRYQVIGNAFTYEVAKAAGLERVWCVVADNQPETALLAQVLAREKLPKMNLCRASWDEIRAGLEYLIGEKRLTGVQLDVATQKIADAPGRKYWTTFEPIAKLKCRVKKSEIAAFGEVFYLDPEPAPPPIARMKKDELLALAQEMGLAVSKKMTVAVLRTLIAQALSHSCS